MDVYDLMLTSDQYSYAGVRISNEGDGAATSLNLIQIGWEVIKLVTILCCCNIYNTMCNAINLSYQ
jgi:hypothetical protein